MLIIHRRWRPCRVECTGSLPTSEVKWRRARLVLGWGTAREDLRVLPAFRFGRGLATPRRRTRDQSLHSLRVGARGAVVTQATRMRRKQLRRATDSDAPSQLVRTQCGQHTQHRRHRNRRAHSARRTAQTEPRGRREVCPFPDIYLRVLARRHAAQKRRRAILGDAMCLCSALRLRRFGVAGGHTASNAPDLFRPPKLSGAGPG